MATMIVPLYGLLKKRTDAPIKLSRIAKARRLTFSSVLKIGSYIIAVDNIRKKLLYFKNRSHTKTCVMIDLNQVDACSISKQYNSIEAGALNGTKLSVFLKSIYMILRFNKMKESVSIPLYESGKDHTSNLEDLEWQVKTCELTISKLLPPQIRERA
jgi:hypothetical protein